MTDFNFVNIILQPFLLSLLIAAGAGLVVRRLYLAKRWVDDPTDATHSKVVHQYPVPRGGGLVVGAGVMAAALLLLPMTKHLAGILAGTVLLMVLGWMDDRKDIHPYWRLLGGLAAALCVVGVGIGIAYISNPFGAGVIHLDQPQLPVFLFDKWRSIWVLSDMFALVWIVWCMNMLNWSKGVDGQLPGIVVIAAAVIGVLSLRFLNDPGQGQMITLAFITSGAFAGLLLWNFYPQRLMPGYGAGSLAGYLLAVLSILSGAKLATLILVLGVPMLDAILVMGKRILSGRSPIWGDRSHFHHVLMDLGWGKRRIAAFYWSATLFLGIIALQLNPRQKPFTIIGISLVFIGVSLWLRWLITYSRLRGPASG
jgi:UDP-GlcNAc:undecaprenyl-phosphate/decaprenyl-phosphate GlcNAc-1-phosphate transferase